MRADMFKIIVERPRRNASHAPHPKLKRTPDPNIQAIGLKRHAYIAARYSKHLNENLAPLVRFLRSRRGRAWDSVFSEICATLDTGSTIKMHVRSHIEDYVLARISVGRRGEWMHEGQVLGRVERWGRGRTFFVDPRDGILKDINDLAPCLPGANGGRKGGAR